MKELIRKHNSRQTRRALFAIIFSILGTAAAFFFFKYFAKVIAWELFDSKSKIIPLLAGIGAVALIYWEGFRRTKNGQGLDEFAESPLYLGLDWSNGGAMLVEMEVARVTGPAYALVQLFLCGPLQLLKCRAYLASRIEPHAGLAQNLQHLLDRIVQNGKWHRVETYHAEYPELRQLVSMELVDFSARKGLVKPATQPNDDHEP